MIFVRMPNILVRQCSFECPQKRSQSEQERSPFGILRMLHSGRGVVRTNKFASFHVLLYV